MAILKNLTVNDSGYITISSGTTLQRPSSPAEGMLRYNTDFKLNEYYNGSQWVTTTGTNSIVQNGLALWLDAGISSSYPGTGTTWYDISGNGRNFNWVSSPSYTSGSLPYFSTLNNRCTGPASNSFGIDNTSGYTIFLICMQNALVSTSAFKFYKNGSGSTGRAIFSHCTWSDDVVYFDQGGCCGSDTRTSVASGGSQTWNIWTFRRFTNSSTRSISKNGETLTTNTAAAVNIDLNATAVDLGSSDEYGGNSSTWNARLGGFIVYNRGLSDAEIALNALVLRSRYGALTSNLSGE